LIRSGELATVSARVTFEASLWLCTGEVAERRPDTKPEELAEVVAWDFY